MMASNTSGAGILDSHIPSMYEIFAPASGGCRSAAHADPRLCVVVIGPETRETLRAALGLHKYLISFH